MEKRLILAIVLSFLVLFLYQLIFVKPPQPEQVVSQQAKGVEKIEAQKGRQDIPMTETAIGGGELLASREAVTAEREQEITIDTPLYTAVWSNRGAVLKSWQLKKHLKKLPDKNDPEAQPLDLVPDNAGKFGLYPLALKLDDPGLMERINEALYQVEADRRILGEDETASLIFEYSDGINIKIRKQFLFNGRDYNFKINTNLEIAGKEVEPVYLWGPGIGSLSPEELKQKFSDNRGAAFLSNRDKKVTRLKEKKIALENEAVRYSGLDWAAYEENYFTSLFLLDPLQSQAFAFKTEVSEAQANGKIAVLPYFYLAVSEPREAYLGPKERQRLVAFGHDTKKIIDFGFFGFIAEIFLVATRYFYSLVPK